MPTDTWTVPVGVTHVFVECWGAGNTATSFGATSVCRGNGGGGGAYSRKRVDVTGVPDVDLAWGDGLADAQGPTTFGAGETYEVKAAGHSGHLGALAADGIGDTKYSGGDGALAPECGPGGAPGGGGGGGAGRNGDGSAAAALPDPTGGVGGDNSPSPEVGNGGAGSVSIGVPGDPGLSTGGGGGGKCTHGAGDSDNGPGSEGGILIYNDTDNHGFDPANRAPIAEFGLFPTPPAPTVSAFRRQLSVM